MDTKKLLEIRKAMKSRKPRFVRQESDRRSRLEKKWRRPRGWQSKMRKNRKGHPARISKGYKSPVAVRGLHPNGLRTIMVNNFDSLENINAKEEGIIISSAVGLKKRIEIIKKAKEKNITILNFKNSDEFLQGVQETLAKKKEEKTKKKETKEKKKKETEKKKPEKLAEKVSLSEEEKKEADKKEKDRLLIKPE
jgi:large subunit ribosomal protein L32e